MLFHCDQTNLFYWEYFKDKKYNVSSEPNIDLN